jgi:hypothetical protein
MYTEFGLGMLLEDQETSGRKTLTLIPEMGRYVGKWI